MAKRITQAELCELKEQLKPLIGLRFRSLSLPIVALEAFEPSQIGTIVGALMDAMIPHMKIDGLGLSKHEGILGDREGYPDYKHESGKRVELKLLYVRRTRLNSRIVAPSSRLNPALWERRCRMDPNATWHDLADAFVQDDWEKADEG